jgi:hypothetical protein
MQAAKRSYAVVWRDGDNGGSGRLDTHRDRFDLSGRENSLSIPFSGLLGATIVRNVAERLRGLPVLLLRRVDGTSIRIASLEGPGVLHELAEQIDQAG